MSSRPWMAGWPCHGPPHTVVRFGVARTSYGSSTVAGFATMPPWSVGPWHCTHPTPPWFSSVNSSTAWRPRSIACSVSASSWLRFASGSKSHVAGTHTTRNTTSKTPQPWSFCSSGVSRSGSDGPGRMVRGISTPSRGRRDRARSTAPATARKTAPPRAITIPWACVSASVASTPGNSCRRHTERPGLRPAKRVGAARRTDDDLRGVNEDVTCRGHLDAEPIEPARRGTELVLAGGVVLRAGAGGLEPPGLAKEGGRTATVHTRREQHTCHHRVEVAQQLLQAEEVPRRLGRVRREVRIGQLAKRSVHERREDDQGDRHQQQRDELLDQEVRPHVDAVPLLAFDALDALRRDERQQAVLLLGALLWLGHVAGRGRCLTRRRQRRGPRRRRGRRRFGG